MMGQDGSGPAKASAKDEYDSSQANKPEDLGESKRTKEWNRYNRQV